MTEPRRTIRVAEDIWRRARARAAMERTPLARVVSDFLENYAYPDEGDEISESTTLTEQEYRDIARAVPFDASGLAAAIAAAPEGPNKRSLTQLAELARVCHGTNSGEPCPCEGFTAGKSQFRCTCGHVQGVHS